MSHTPGPWRIHDHTVWGPRGEEIAALSDEDGPLHRVNGEKRKAGPRSLAILEANERLIVSAPGLLEALTKLVEHRELAGLVRGELAELVKHARGVIAQVTSE
jgi:hypothetical protein